MRRRRKCLNVHKKLSIHKLSKESRMDFEDTLIAQVVLLASYMYWSIKSAGISMLTYIL